MLEDIVEAVVLNDAPYEGIKEYIDQLTPSFEAASELYSLLSSYDGILEVYTTLLNPEYLEYLDDNQKNIVRSRLSLAFDEELIHFGL